MGLLSRVRSALTGDGVEVCELADGWWIRLPDQPAVEYAEDGSVVLWNDHWTIHVATRATPGEHIAAERLLAPMEDAERERTGDGMLLDLGAERAERIDGREIWTVRVQAAVADHAAVLAFHGYAPGVRERSHAAARTLWHGVPRPV